MVNDASERREAFDESLISESMIDTKAIRGRAPSPFLLVAMPCTPQIDEANPSYGSGNHPTASVGLNFSSTGSTILFGVEFAGSNGALDGQINTASYDNLEADINTPLPSTWLMLLSGFVGLGFFAYRGTKKNAVAFAAA